MGDYIFLQNHNITIKRVKTDYKTTNCSTNIGECRKKGNSTSEREIKSATSNLSLGGRTHIAYLSYSIKYSAWEQVEVMGKTSCCTYSAQKVDNNECCLNLLDSDSDCITGLPRSRPVYDSDNAQLSRIRKTKVGNERTYPTSSADETDFLSRNLNSGAGNLNCRGLSDVLMPVVTTTMRMVYRVHSNTTSTVPATSKRE